MAGFGDARRGEAGYGRVSSGEVRCGHTTLVLRDGSIPSVVFGPEGLRAWSG